MVLMNVTSFDRRPVMIILVGLCGSGKSTLSKMLWKKLKASIFNIGDCRIEAKKMHDYFMGGEDYEMTTETNMLLEAEAWSILYYSVIKHIERGNNLILDTSGLNKRLQWIIDELYLSAKIIKIKLVCPLSVLNKRLKNRKEKQTGFFPYDQYKGHAALNKDLIKSIGKVTANITVNTSKLHPIKVYYKVKEGLKKYGV